MDFFNTIHPLRTFPSITYRRLMKPVVGVITAALLIAGPLSAVAGSPTAPPRTLSYPTHPRATVGRYTISLQPDRDVRGEAAVLDLVVRPTDAQRGDNLLEPAGHWHGLQPFTFAARDFGRGATTSAYGRERLIPITGTSDAVRITVLKSELGPEASWTGGALRLDVAVLSRTAKGR